LAKVGGPRSLGPNEAATDGANLSLAVTISRSLPQETRPNSAEAKLALAANSIGLCAPNSPVALELVRLYFVVEEAPGFGRCILELGVVFRRAPVNLPQTFNKNKLDRQSANNSL